MIAAPREWGRPLAIALVGGSLMFAIGLRRVHRNAVSQQHVELRVPRAKDPLNIDGTLDEREWMETSVRTGAFVLPDGVAARPFSEARLMWDATNLYVALYAADDDIRLADVPADGPVWTADAFRLLFTNSDGTRRAIDVGPSGTMTDAIAPPGGAFDYAWESGATARPDLDGTPNDPTDRDEEWVVEMAIPLRALGLVARPGERIAFTVRRCDVDASGRRCGAWGDATGGFLQLR